MEIKVLGPGCNKCRHLYEETEKAIAAAGIEADLVKVDRVDEIMQYGVLVTPALVIDGNVKFAGKVPSVEDLARMIAEAAG